MVRITVKIPRGSTNIRFDARTRKWFRERYERLAVDTTLMRCNACGLYYKPSLGHDCKESRRQEATDERSS